MLTSEVVVNKTPKLDKRIPQRLGTFFLLSVLKYFPSSDITIMGFRNPLIVRDRMGTLLNTDNIYNMVALVDST